MKGKHFAMYMAFVILISGCTTTLNQPLSNIGNATNFSFNGTGDNQSLARPECTVMLCLNGGDWISHSWWFPLFGTYIKDNTLYEGSCWFQQITAANLENRIDSNLYRTEPDLEILPQFWGAPSNKEYMRFFMYGQGPTFSEFDEANAYCLNNMTMAVKWRIGNSTNLPYVGVLSWEERLQRSRAECYLRASVIPVYIFYTDSLNIDSINTENFVLNFMGGGGEIGPIVIDPEFSYDINKPGVVNDIIDSIRRIRNSCSRCIIMLSPPEENMTALDAILEHPVDGPEMNNTVDIIGQGWTMNKDENCSFYESLIRKVEFSRKILNKYNKPTLWTYLAISNSTNYNYTCDWSDRDVANAMDLIYTNTPALVSAGGIGLAHYQLLDDYGPMLGSTLNCTTSNCSFGLMQRDESKKEQMFNMWFRRCQEYYGVGDNFSQVPVVFNYWGDNGSACDIIGHLGTYKMIDVTTIPENPPGFPSRPTEIYNCDRCFGNITDLSITAMYPLGDASSWYVLASPFFDDLHMAIGWHSVASPIDCEIYHASVRKHSELGCRWEMDPLFIRAAMKRDSSYDTCDVKYVPITDTSCNPLNIINPPISDPSGLCPDTRIDMEVNPATGECEPGGGGVQCKPCTYGLLRCPLYPYTTQAYGGDGPYGCGMDFNPFDVQMGLCCGVNTLCEAMDKAATWAYGNAFRRNELKLHPSPDNWAYEERDKWTILLLTLAVYHANGDVTVLDDYFNHWQDTKWCPNAVDIPAWHRGIGVDVEGPSKTFIWTYCNVYNDSGTIFWGPTPDPWQACTSVSEFGTCHIDCCKSGAGGTIDLGAFDPNPVALGWTDAATYHNACVTAPECCNSPVVCPNGFVSIDPDTYRCNTVNSCCGGSFFEHLCCMEPYACEVLDFYNQTIQECDAGGFCRRF
ncbi:MAG: hypothetical protein ABIG39_01270 [Candidatus Micrarchaeota archaeon]